MKRFYIIPIFTFTVLLSGCSGCSKSGRKVIPQNNNRPLPVNSEKTQGTGKKTVLKMERLNNVYQIPVDINGIPMYFIFDTGAGMISISETEVLFLYKQGKLTDADIVGTANFSDANGNISEGTIIILRTVKIGDRTLNNIEASVVHNMDAPLLIGQSALEKFGKISIDYQRGEITFE